VRFVDFPLSESIQESIRQAGFEKPTPIQAASIPHSLEGKDVIGLAQTGTGKTAAFAIPIIQRLAQRTELGGLVLAPTRELAAQITVMFNQLGVNSGIRVATIVGGVPMDRDAKALKSWPNVLVATPGRLLDHIENNSLSLAEIEVLVVDEADRMHDMGFIPQIRRILAALPEKRQTLMFTATMPPDVERIARRSMKDPVRVQIGVTAPAQRARQELFELPEEGKAPLLLRLLAKSDGRVLVFVRTKRGVDRLARTIGARGFHAVRIHGDLEQAHRDKSLAEFRHGRCRVMVATDIAARGLDISGIEHVINYDFPHHAEDYVHRIGRTARVDASGLATSFVTRLDRRFVAEVRRLIGDKLPAPEPVEGYTPSADHPSDHGPGRPGRDRGRGRGGRGRGRGQGGSQGHGQGHGQSHSRAHGEGQGQGQQPAHAHGQSSSQGPAQGHGQDHAQTHAHGQEQSHGADQGGASSQGEGQYQSADTGAQRRRRHNRDGGGAPAPVPAQAPATDQA
jgi:ATP-dependent RNA helicase RhlE